MAEKKEVKNDMCRCGHERKHHGKSSSINYTEGKCRKCWCQGFVIVPPENRLDIKYDYPIQVTKEKLDYLKPRFSMQIAFRKDDNGQWWVKLWDMRDKERFERELNK